MLVSGKTGASIKADLKSALLSAILDPFDPLLLECDGFTRIADSLRAIRQIVLYVYNEMPSTCHGSREAVEAWLKMGSDPL
ncbi:MAG: hypothetical protein ACHP7J_00145 [Terriglobales bacterium]